MGVLSTIDNRVYYLGLESLEYAERKYSSSQNRKHSHTHSLTHTQDDCYNAYARVISVVMCFKLISFNYVS